MNQVLKGLSKNDGENRIAVLRLELDYELATLYEAMTEQNIGKIKDCKRKLEKLRLELLKLENLKK